MIAFWSPSNANGSAVAPASVGSLAARATQSKPISTANMTVPGTPATKQGLHATRAAPATASGYVDVKGAPLLYRIQGAGSVIRIQFA